MSEPVEIETATEVVEAPPAAPAPVPTPERGGMSLRLRLFIILSFGAHMFFFMTWGVPAYIKHRAEVAAIEESKRVAQQLKEAELRGREEAKRQSLEATKKEVAEVLKQDFDKIVQSDLNKDSKNKMWEEVQKGLNDKLENYATELASATASDADLEGRLEDMKGAMVNELEKDLRGQTVKEMADDYVDSIGKDVVPKLAADYRKNVERAVGAPLQQEGARIIRDEKTLVERERTDLKNALDTAVKDAERARDDLAAAKERIKNAQDTANQTVKDAKERESANVKGEETGIEQAQNQIKSAIDELKKVADATGSKEIKDKIAQATSKDGDTATKETGDAKDAASKGDGNATKQHAVAAGDASKKLGDAIGQINGAIDAGPGDAKDKQAAKAGIAAAKKQADAAAAGLKGVNDRLGKAEAGTAAAEKTAAQQSGRVAANESKNLASDDAALKDADAKLGKASEKAAAFGDDLKDKIAGAASNEGKTAETKVGAARTAAGAGKLDDMAANVDAAADAAKKLADAATSARTAADSAQFDAAGLARAVMKGLEGSEVKGQLDDAFARNFENNALLRLTQKLGDAFQNSLAKDGIQDDSTVAEVRARISDLLKDKVAGLTHAGDAGTDALDKSEGIGNAKDDDKKNSARVKAVGDKFRKTVAGLTDKPLSDVTGDTREDDAIMGIANTDLAAEQGSGAHHGKHGKGGADGGAAGAGGDGNGDGADGGGNNMAGLLARVQNLSKNVKAGRMGFLEGGDGSADGDGDGAGGGMAGAKNSNGAAGSAAGSAGSAGAGGAGGAGNGNGMGGAGAGGPGGIAGLRQHALNRGTGLSHGIFRGSSGNYTFNKDDHAKLTDGIHDRDLNAAQGDAFERKGAIGEVSSADAIKDRIVAGVVLVPAPPKGDVVGAPVKDDPYKPRFKTINFAAVPYLPKPMSIDGDFSKWKDIPVQQMKNHDWDDGKHDGLKLFPSQDVKIAWDNTGLYFFYDVKDADGTINKVKARNFWEGDAVEVFFDARNTKDKSRGSAWTQQFWVWPFGMAGDDNMVGGEAIKDAPDKDFREAMYGMNEIQRAAKKTPEGWQMEVHLPFDRIKNFSAQPGRIFGLNLSICTGSPLYYYWAGTSAVRTSEHPDTWGDVLLAGSDGKLEVVDKLSTELKSGETAKPLASIQIGAALKIRVTDADMNLSDKRRDKLSVTVKSRGSGEVRIVTLEETGEKTGVFEGAIGTDLNMGDPSTKALQLFEGERINVIYLDQARGNGARNVEVKLPIRTSAGVFQIAGAK